jgi:hypothetical protein
VLWRRKTVTREGRRQPTVDGRRLQNQGRGKEGWAGLGFECYLYA